VPAGALRRILLLLPAGLSLIAALDAGLFRIGWPLPLPQPDLPLAHGPLMVCGFLGTLIALEKAVALGKTWAYAGVLATAAGGVGMAAATHATVPRLLFFLGSLGLVFVSATFLARHRTDANACVLSGAVLWAAGNALFLLGWPVFAVAPAWMGFLLLTIAGERLELNRLLSLSRATRLSFFVFAALVVGAIGLAALGFARGGSVVFFEGGNRFTSSVFDLALRLLGLSCAGIGLWLLANDMARFAWKKPGLSRFMAVSLLAGYLWLTVSGTLFVLEGAVVAGETYDAVLHSFFLGFVFSMIFAHGPVILPAILSRPLEFHPVFYAHLSLLHAGLVLRLAGDLTDAVWLRPWGGLLNAAAILVFLLSSALRTTLGGAPQRATIVAGKIS
jgi:hypothetical protein